MGPRIKNEFMRLCRSLLYMAAIYLCPEMRRRRSEAAGPGAYSRPCGAAPAKGGASERPEESAARVFTIFGKVLYSLPISFHCIGSPDVFIYQYQFKKRSHDFGARPAEEKEPYAVRYARRAEGSLKTGFDFLRRTLNLARGDLEAAAAR